MSKRGRLSDKEVDVTMSVHSNPIVSEDSESDGGSTTANGAPEFGGGISIAADEDDDVIRLAHHPPLLGHGQPSDSQEPACCVIDGDAAWQDSWDVLHMLIILYIFLELPLRLGFRWTVVPVGEPVPSELYMSPETDLLIDLLMFLDMISRFFTTYTWHDFYGDSFVVRDQHKIFRHYLRSEFFIDFISCMPVDTVVRLLRVGDSTYGAGWMADHVRVLRLARAARLKKLVILFRSHMIKISETVRILAWLKDSTSMIITVVCMLAWNHFICCFLAWAGSPLHDAAHCDADGVGFYVKPGSCDSEQGCDTDCVPCDIDCVTDELECEYLMPCGWVTRTNQVDVQKKSFLNAYVTTYYWGFTIITTIGFGDISGSSTRERFLLVAAMMVGALSFGIVIGRVGSMVQSQSMGRIAYDSRFRELEEYMRYRSTSQRLRYKVYDYLKTKFPNRTIFNESQILNGLPDKLRVEIQIENYYNAIDAVPFLPADDVHVRTAICSRLVPMTFMQGEHILHEGAIGREMYLIEHGKVAFVHEYQDGDEILCGPCPSLNETGTTKAGAEGQEGRQSAPATPPKLTALNILASFGPEEASLTPWRESPYTLFEEGAYFGEIAVLVPVRRTRSALADTFTNLLRLDKDTMDHCAEDFPKLRKVIDAFTTKKLKEIIAASSNEKETWVRILADHEALCRTRDEEGAYQTHRHLPPSSVSSKAFEEEQDSHRDLAKSLTSGNIRIGQGSLTARQSIMSDSDKLDLLLSQFDDFQSNLRRLEGNQAKMERKLVELQNRDSYLA